MPMHERVPACSPARPHPPQPSPRVVAEPQVAPDDVLEQALRGLLAGLRLADDHVAQHGPHSEEALGGGAHIVEPDVVQQDLLDDERGDRLGQLGPDLHRAQAQRDDLR